MRRPGWLAWAVCAGLLTVTACGQQDAPDPVAPSTASPSTGASTGTEPDRDEPVVLRYDMDETSGTVMTDGGNSGADGEIGSDIELGSTVAGATGYGFDTVDPAGSDVRPGHLAVIPDSPAVDPGDLDYSVEIRYRTDDANGANLIQKGQAKSPGGQFKIQVPEGNPQCYYKGSLGKVGATSQRKLDDGTWHVLRCSRTADGVSLYVDGELAKEHSGPTGTIDNTFAMTIGGKSDCDMVKVECDYFGGTIDYVEITKG